MTKYREKLSFAAGCGRRTQFWVILGLLAVTLRIGAQAPSGNLNLPNGTGVIAYLNQVIDWHRQVAAQEALATDPSDVIFVDNARQTSNQVLQLAFDFAKSDAALLAKQKSPSPAAPAGSAQSLTQAVSSVETELRQEKSDLQSLQQQVARTSGRRRRQLQAQIETLQGELELDQARSDTLHTLVQFAGGQASGGNLLGQITELQRSVPGFESGTVNMAMAPRNTATPARRPQPSGLVGLIEDLLDLRRKMNTLDDGISRTDTIERSSADLRRPLVATLAAMAKQGDEAVVNSSSTGTSEKDRLEALTAQFKQLSGVVLPLGKQAVLYPSYRNNLQNWKSAVHTQYSLDVRRLLVRLAVLMIAVIVVIGLAELWRSAIFRYVHDMRRRYQFLLLRRIVIWIAIAIAIAFALASEIGSIATFIGLITAGVAVALQNVIMAIAGYFFLIGKYGVRVGDRVQIAGVTGDVVDIGLIRLHLLEVSSVDTGRQPTGRVVVFSNAVVFQPGASFFKQIPGTNFTWHQLTLTLAPETDYRLAEKRIIDAVDSVYSSYRPLMERQHQQMLETLNVNVDLPKPRSRLHFTEGGLEIVVRFPAELEHAAEIDGEVTRKLLDAIEQSPRLKLVGTGSPNIQPVAESDTPQAKAS